VRWRRLRSMPHNRSRATGNRGNQLRIDAITLVIVRQPIPCETDPSTSLNRSRLGWRLRSRLGGRTPMRSTPGGDRVDLGVPHLAFQDDYSRRPLRSPWKIRRSTKRQQRLALSPWNFSVSPGNRAWLDQNLTIEVGSSLRRPLDFLSDRWATQNVRGDPVGVARTAIDAEPSLNVQSTAVRSHNPSQLCPRADVELGEDVPQVGVHRVG
jgi:hypothetical protein